MRANVELLTAPTREITAPKFGIMAARATAAKKSNNVAYFVDTRTKCFQLAIQRLFSS